MYLTVLYLAYLNFYIIATIRHIRNFIIIITGNSDVGKHGPHIQQHHHHDTHVEVMIKNNGIHHKFVDGRRGPDHSSPRLKSLRREMKENCNYYGPFSRTMTLQQPYYTRNT
jgi:hypothetical protein